MQKIYLLLLFMTISLPLWSQASIYGKITDQDTGEEMIYANVMIMVQDSMINGVSTDFEGNYSIPVAPGSYQILITYTGYPDFIVEQVEVLANTATKLDIEISQYIQQVDIALPRKSTVYGKVTDHETGEELIYTNLVFSQNGTFVTGTVTDFDGNYSVRLYPGTYEVSARYTGFFDYSQTFEVVRGVPKSLNIKMETGMQINSYSLIHYVAPDPPLINQANTSTGKTIPDVEIQRMPTKNVHEIISTVPGISFQQ